MHDLNPATPNEAYFEVVDAMVRADYGVTYGCQTSTSGSSGSRSAHPVCHARTPWQEAIDLPGATQAGSARTLYESRPFTRLVPDHGAIAAASGWGHDRILVVDVAAAGYAMPA